MGELEDYWKDTREQLFARRLNPGYDLDQLDCRTVANHIAGILHSVGADPFFYFIDDIDDKGTGICLKPLGFDGYHSYAGHVVCVSECLVYDPHLEYPTPLEDYPMAAFGKPLIVTKLLEKSMSRAWRFDTRETAG